MPTASIIQSLSYVNWTLLMALALGSVAVVALVRATTDATRGYLGFTAFSGAVLGLLALATDLGLPAPDRLAIVAAPGLDAPRRFGIGAFVVLALLLVVQIARGRRALAPGVLAVAAGGAVLALAAWGWTGALPEAVPLLVQLLVLSAAAGGSLATLVLAHWYLVTPRLSERPLVLLARALTLVVATQLLLFVVWVTLGTGADAGPFRPLFGGSALFIWLRLLVGLLFPLAVSWMSLRTARTRSMESATGLLYIGFAAIASGTIVAAGLYYASGLLV